MQGINSASVNGLLSSEATQVTAVYIISKSAQQITKWLEAVVWKKWMYYWCTFSNFPWKREQIQISETLAKDEFGFYKNLPAMWKGGFLSLKLFFLQKLLLFLSFCSHFE